MNFKLTIQYDGTEFHGWQIQQGLRTVQGELTRVLTVLEGEPAVLHGSGRTDAGVHAEGQVANVHLKREFTPEKLRAAINGNLPVDVRVLKVETVADNFHARYSARGKTYVYRIVNNQVVSPFWVRYAHQEARVLNLQKMKAYAELFLGSHDWTAFSAAQSDIEERTRHITKLDICASWNSRGQASLIEIEISADGFLRYMVRSIAGTLLAVGRDEIGEEQIRRALTSGERSLAGATAPACGLTLVSVEYGD